jgi:hypothetical protein
LLKLSSTPPTLLPTPFVVVVAVAAALPAAPYSTAVCAAAGLWQAKNPSTHPETRQNVRIAVILRR